jgi:2-phospho-L-lactate guanylyltransferase (CobY/MobA/RfbA family)
MISVESLAILVPLKGFALGKSRLREGGVRDVDDLARSLARRVLRACEPRPLLVACESDDVAAFAAEMGVEVLLSNAHGLNEALSLAYSQLASRFARLVIAHGDLREPEGLGLFDPPPGVTIFSDIHRAGTNVLALPTGLDFRFRFGPDSAVAHQREAQRLNVEVRMDFDSPWRFDVDEPGDLVG